jgi:glyoxylate utilization-related uncharacterized protein
MFNVRIGFAPGTRVRADVHAVRRTNLHAHSNALEIVYVLHGALHVVVSSEAFDLDAGDYAVLNRSDPHLLEGSADNVTAVLHFDLSSFVDSAVTPCLVLEYSGRDATSALINSLARQLRSVGADGVSVWLVYSGSHARSAVDQLIDVARDEHGLTVQAILMP